MVCLVINGKKLPGSDKLVRMLCEIEGMRSISYSINREKTNVIMGKETVNLYGPGYITDYIGNVKYQISPSPSIRSIPSRQKALRHSTGIRRTDRG